MNSKKGVGGGYLLAKAPSEITRAEMIVAVEGRAQLTQCCSETSPGDEDCTLLSSCRLRLPIQRVQEGLWSYLNAVSLSDLAFEETIEIGLPPKGVAAGRVVREESA